MNDTITKRGEKLAFNVPDDLVNVVAMRLNRCAEVECKPTGFFLTYPREDMVQAKADLDILRDPILANTPIVLMLEEFDGELWLTVGVRDNETLIELAAQRKVRIVHHLSQQVMGNSQTL